MTKINIGVRTIVRIIPMNEPIAVSLAASYPLPFKRSLCPGRMDKAVDSSGAPRKMEGMKSKNEWAIAIETMKTARTIGEVNFNKKAAEANIIRATRFMWMPGNKPVNVPAINPKNKAMKISSSILVNFIFSSILIKLWRKKKDIP